MIVKTYPLKTLCFHYVHLRCLVWFSKQNVISSYDIVPIIMLHSFLKEILLSLYSLDGNFENLFR